MCVCVCVCVCDNSLHFCYQNQMTIKFTKIVIIILGPC